MRREHAPPGEPLERRRARVVGGERLDRPGPRDPRDVPEEHEGERERRQEERVELRQERQIVEDAGDAGEPVEEGRPEDRDQDRAEHEVGDHREREPRDGDRAVERLASANRGDHAGEDAERHAEDERVEREQARPLQRGNEVVGHGAPVGVVRAEVAADRVAQPVGVADG